MTSAALELTAPTTPAVRPWREGDIYTLTVGPNRDPRASAGVQPRQRALLAIVVAVNGDGSAMLDDEEGDSIAVAPGPRSGLRFVSTLSAWRRRRRMKRPRQRVRQERHFYFDGVDRGSWDGFVAAFRPGWR